MIISSKQIKKLQKLLKKQTGKNYSDEEAQETSLAIIRFVLVEETQEQSRVEANSVNIHLSERGNMVTNSSAEHFC
jgi:hypothetical protein